MRLQDELRQQLDRSGWDVTRRAGERDHRAWYREVWTLESRQSPRGFTLYLTFLTDPQPGNPNPFWLVGTSRRFPEKSSPKKCCPNSLIISQRGIISEFIRNPPGG